MVAELIRHHTSARQTRKNSLAIRIPRYQGIAHQQIKGFGVIVLDMKPVPVVVPKTQLNLPLLMLIAFCRPEAQVNGLIVGNEIPIVDIIVLVHGIHPNRTLDFFFCKMFPYQVGHMGLKIQLQLGHIRCRSGEVKLFADVQLRGECKVDSAVPHHFRKGLEFKQVVLNSLIGPVYDITEFFIADVRRGRLGPDGVLQICKVSNV